MMIDDHKKTILLVEDEAILAMTQKVALEKYGYRVLTVSSGEKAIETVQAVPEIQLILMDIDLGKGIDGTEAAAVILKDHDIPVVFCSCHTEPDIVEKTEKITSYGYVVKSSSNTVLDVSIKMAFKLFEANRKALEELHQRQIIETALEKHILALTQPLDQNSQISFADLFDIAAIQKIQDDFSKATNVASIITLPDGTPLTRPSNFTYLCSSIFRQNPKSCANCYKSDAELGKVNADAPIIQPCLSGGLWDAGTSITVGSQHLANWLIGQVRDETQTEAKIIEYARQIGADETTVLEAFRAVPSMKLDKFRDIAQALYSFAKQLSDIAYQNVQQARFITQQKQVEEKLKKSEERYRHLLFNLEAGVIVYAADASIIMNNAHATELLGLSDKQLRGQEALDPHWQFVQADRTPLPPSQHPFQVISASQKALKVQILGVYTPKKPIVWLSVNGFPLLDTDGAITEIVISFTDISERKVAEEHLRETNDLIESFVKFSPIYTFIKEASPTESRVIAASDNFEEMIGIPGSQMIGKTMDQLFPAAFAEKITADDWTVAAGGKVIKVDEHLNNRHYTTIKFPLNSGEKKVMAGYTIDITERWQAEKQKELMLKEVHHRVKNSMAILKAMLTLQAESKQDLGSRRALEEAAVRVQTMGLLYEKLYQSLDSTELSVQDYLVPLIDEILANFPSATTVKVDKKIDNFILDAQRLQPIGIIINELLTNIMKYAFVSKDEGLITVSVELTAGIVKLVVEDNGIGLDPAVDFEHSTGFGLSLVKSLATQLSGTIGLEHVDGTKVVLEFKH